MNNMNRRQFIKSSAAALALSGTSLFGVSCSDAEITPNNDDILLRESVRLGSTSLNVPIIAMGTGTVGWGGSSNQTRMGMSRFIQLAHNAYDHGLRFYDMAEAYGSHRFVGEAIKDMPRENIILLTKMSTSGNENVTSIKAKLDNFRREVGTEYFDIVLMHYMTSGDWPETRKGAMEGLARAKDDGIIKATGISCHSLEAIHSAAESAWLDVILARINPFQSNMDGSPDQIKNALANVRKKGKGVIGMKIFGEGSRVRTDERQQSLKFALTESNIHCMTIGFETIDQMNDAIIRVNRIQKEIKES